MPPDGEADAAPGNQHPPDLAHRIGRRAQTPRKLVTTSKVASSQGRACMSPTRMSAAGLRSRATATSRWEASRPAQTAPRRRASSSARPLPQATSRSRSPSSMPSRARMTTYSRQLYGSLSVAKSAALRPHPSSTTVHAARDGTLSRIPSPPRRDLPRTLSTGADLIHHVSGALAGRLEHRGESVQGSGYERVVGPDPALVAAAWSIAAWRSPNPCVSLTPP